MFGATTKEAMPQASVEPLLTWAPVIEAFPVASKWTVIFWVVTTGLTVSATVTVAVPVFTFPFKSVTVKVTVFVPILAQVNELGVTDIIEVLIPQASVDPLLIWEAVIDAVPVAFNWTVMSLVTTTGLTVSAIVTIAVPVLAFPFTSVTVKVTVLAPMFEQVNELGDTDMIELFIPQASVEPLFTCDGKTIILPVASKWAVIFWVITLGLIVSKTVTIAVPVLTLLFTSLTVKVTVLVPTFKQLKLLGVTINVEIPQASVEPLLIELAVIEAEPLAFKYIVLFWVFTIGVIVSNTVTIEVAVFTLPFTSVTESVTVFAPMLAQVNVLGEAPKVAILQLSVEPLFNCEPAILAFPVASKYTEIFLAIALGLIVSITVTIAVPVWTLLLKSVAVKVTVFGPTWVQLNEVGETTNEVITHASLVPLLTWFAVIKPVLPAAFKYAFIFLVLTIGLTVSWTITVATRELTLLLASLAVKTTVFGPTWAQVNEFGNTLIVKLQASEVPLSTWLGKSVRFPVESNWAVIFFVKTTGRTVSLTLIEAVTESLFPPASVTIK